MSSIVRSVLGVAVLLTGASAAMAQSANPPVAGQTVQAGASTALVASNNAPVVNQTVQTNASTALVASNAPVAGQSVQTGASTAIAASSSAPVAGQSKPLSKICDKSDPHGGHGPNTHWGIRSFWEYQQN